MEIWSFFKLDVFFIFLFTMTTCVCVYETWNQFPLQKLISHNRLISSYSGKWAPLCSFLQLTDHAVVDSWISFAAGITWFIQSNSDFRSAQSHQLVSEQQTSVSPVVSPQISVSNMYVSYVCGRGPQTRRGGWNLVADAVSVLGLAPCRYSRAWWDYY